jgi:hypothetical protein
MLLDHTDRHAKALSDTCVACAVQSVQQEGDSSLCSQAIEYASGLFKALFALEYLLRGRQLAWDVDFIETN